VMQLTSKIVKQLVRGRDKMEFKRLQWDLGYYACTARSELEGDAE